MSAPLTSEQVNYLVWRSPTPKSRTQRRASPHGGPASSGLARKAPENTLPQPLGIIIIIIIIISYLMCRRASPTQRKQNTAASAASSFLALWFEKSTFSFQDDCRAQQLEEKFKTWVKPGALINIIQKGLQYLALEASIYEVRPRYRHPRSLHNQDRSAKGSTQNGSTGSAKTFAFFGPSSKTEEPSPVPPPEEIAAQDAQGDIEMAQTPPPYDDTNGTISESEVQKPESLREPPQPNGTVTPIKRSHELAVATASELNGALNQRSKRAKTVTAPDENAMVIDGIGLPDTTSEEVRATIGSSVGVQADEYIQLDHESSGVYQISPQDTSLDSSARNCKFNPGENNLLAVSYANCHLLDLNDNLSAPSQISKDTNLSQQPGEEMSTIVWSDNGEYLATSSWDGLIKIWDSNGRSLHSLSVHRAPILSLKFHPTKHNLLLSVDGHSKVNVWDVAVGKLKRLCELAKGNTASEKTTPHDADWIDETTIIIVGDSGAVEKFDLSLPQEKGSHLESVARYEGHDAHKHVNSVVWSSGHGMFATGGEEGKILLWKTTQQKPVGVLEGHQNEISSLQLSHGSSSSESLLGSSSADGNVRIWNIESRICLHVLNMQSPVNALSFTADGRYLAAGAQSLLVMIWRTETGQLAGIYDAKQGDDGLSTQSTMEDLSWDKTGSRLAVAVRDQKCAIIDWKTLLEEAAAKKSR
ncbi:hypothetical protein Dda_4451 [Drechslerella dactyloides]|uniref:WD40 repeat-like protein n=1 Tax=Drechslerella dactyloides TaxID=74499 RepID=A0AAD6NJA3_DREDA|nr:hypothetical protein Dda_4451 [Drechslerella dactyloides]